MSDTESTPALHFEKDGRVLSIEPSADIDAIIRDWDSLRSHMVRDLPDEFTRDEWAYLIGFVSERELTSIYQDTFGSRSEGITSGGEVIEPRGNVALWAPNNVSLLAPLTMILVSITGNDLRVKGGSSSKNLITPLVDWIVQKNPSGPLTKWLQNCLSVEVFDRSSPLNEELSMWADVRMVFGSDAACRGVNSLPTSASTSTYLFSDRVSHCWADVGALDRTRLDGLLKVFRIYGSRGCTSPRSLTLIGADSLERDEMASRILNQWQATMRSDVEMHVASQNVLSAQICRIEGWDVDIAARNSAVLARGPNSLGAPSGDFTMGMTTATLEEAVANLPGNIQTIGHIAGEGELEMWRRVCRDAGVLRFVPVEEMHHFGPVWDGMDYWRGMFTEVIEDDTKT